MRYIVTKSSSYAMVHFKGDNLKENFQKFMLIMYAVSLVIKAY